MCQLRALGLVTAMCFVVFMTAFTVSRMQSAEVVKLAEENQRLRLFNSRQIRRYKKPDATVNQKACAEAEHIEGVPGVLVGAVWRQENGPPDIETGVLGKTDWVVKNYPLEYWPAIETARTLNIYVWSYMARHPKVMQDFIKQMSKPYTGNTKPEAWAKNVFKFYQESK